MKNISPFAAEVMNQIKSIPSGKVATYSQIARLAGKPHAARGVSWILHSCSTTYKLPWHRVLNTQGKISFKKDSHNYRQQRKKLQMEGVEFSAADQIDMRIFQWKKDVKVPTESSDRKPKMFR